MYHSLSCQHFILFQRTFFVEYMGIEPICRWASIHQSFCLFLYRCELLYPIVWVSLQVISYPFPLTPYGSYLHNLFFFLGEYLDNARFSADIRPICGYERIRTSNWHRPTNKFATNRLYLFGYISILKNHSNHIANWVIKCNCYLSVTIPRSPPLTTITTVSGSHRCNYNF